MKVKSIFYMVALLISLSCSKQNDLSRELDITITPGLKSAIVETNSAPTFYPNPFSEVLNLDISTNSSYIINISSIDGYTKREFTANVLALNFSNERNGTYNCEIRTEGKVYKTVLVKTAP